MNRITERAARAEWNIKCGKHPSPQTLLADIMIRDAIRRPGRDPARYVPCAEHCIGLWEQWIADLICGDEEEEE